MAMHIVKQNQKVWCGEPCEHSDPAYVCCKDCEQKECPTPNEKCKHVRNISNRVYCESQCATQEEAKQWLMNP